MQTTLSMLKRDSITFYFYFEEKILTLLVMYVRLCKQILKCGSFSQCVAHWARLPFKFERTISLNRVWLKLSVVQIFSMFKK